MNLYRYYDPDGKGIIQVKASRPWIVREFNPMTKAWDLPCFPEIIWDTLNDLVYLGVEKIK